MNIPNSLKFSNKHIQIDKNYAKMVGTIAGAAAIIAVSIVLSVSLIKQVQYQNKVIGARTKANNQLKANNVAVQPLVAAYRTFNTSPESVIGTKDNNSKIVLDALPSKYDFPALATSLEYIIKQSGARVDSISGTDNEAEAEQNSSAPQVIEIPVSVTAFGSFSTDQRLVKDFERSIRPFVIKNIELSGSDGNLKATLTLATYYQPEKTFEVKQVVVPGTSSKAKASTTTEGVSQ